MVVQDPNAVIDPANPTGTAPGTVTDPSATPTTPKQPATDPKIQ